jgi:DNA-binding NarL/FixJ family response regulator
MDPGHASCVLLAERHSCLTECIRGLLANAFDVVVMVADDFSLLETARRLRPTMVIVDLSLPGTDATGLLRRLRAACADVQVIALSVHDESVVARAVLEAGAGGCVLKRAVPHDLLPAIVTILAGGTYVSSGFRPDGARPPGG